MKMQKQGEKKSIVTNSGHQHGTQVDKNDYLMFILSIYSFFSLTTCDLEWSLVGSFELDGKKIKVVKWL